VWYEFFALTGLVLTLIGGFLQLAFGSAAYFLVELHLLVGVTLLILGLVLGLFLRRKNSSTLFAAISLPSMASALLVVILSILFLFSVRFDLEWDLTLERMHSLYPETVDFLENVKAPLTITFVLNKNEDEYKELKRFKQLVSRVSNPNIKTIALDPIRDIRLIDQLQLEAGDKVHIELIQDKEPRVARLSTLSELDLLSELVALAKIEKENIYYVTGAAEGNLKKDGSDGYSEMARLIGHRHYKLIEISLRELLALEEPSPLVIWANPSGKIEPELLSTVSDRLTSDIRLMFLGSVDFAEQSRQLFESIGIYISSGLVIDPVQQLATSSPLVLFLQRFPNPHPIVAPFVGQGGVLLERASALRLTTAEQDPALYPLLVSGESAIEQLADGTQASGPHTLAVTYEKDSDGDDGSRLVIFGSSDWASNRFFSLYNNRDIFKQSLEWLADSEAEFTAEKKRGYRSEVTPLSEEKWQRIFVLGVILPELVLLLGIYVWWRRRQLVPKRKGS